MFGAKPELIIKGGMILAFKMGDATSFQLSQYHTNQCLLTMVKQ